MKILLDEILSKKEISRRKLSIMTGIPHSTIQDIASMRSMPRIDNLERIAKALHICISDLYDSPYK